MGFLGAAPSFWYLISFWAFPAIGIVWLWKPQVAAPLCIGPLFSLVLQLRFLPWMASYSMVWAVTFVSGLLVAISLVVIALRESLRWLLPVCLSILFVCCAFATDRLLTNQTTIRLHQMYVAIDGRAPWGDVEGAGSSNPVVLYRKIGAEYCYLATNSDELRKRLAGMNGKIVSVEYNIFSDFGKERGYNIRSVDGLILAEGERPVGQYDWEGGRILEGTQAQSSTDDCP